MGLCTPLWGVLSVHDYLMVGNRMSSCWLVRASVTLTFDLWEGHQSFVQYLQFPPLLFRPYRPGSFCQRLKEEVMFVQQNIFKGSLLVVFSWFWEINISHGVPMLFCMMSLKFILLKLLPHLPRANECVYKHTKCESGLKTHTRCLSISIPLTFIILLLKCILWNGYQIWYNLCWGMDIWCQSVKSTSVQLQS